MTSIALALISLTLLFLGYRFYSPRVARWLDLNENKSTPAVELNDGVDYVPARHWTILFGHHFASIAGAAPIIGPVMACLYWGWLPALIWLVVGGIIFGAVHDFSALVLSLENRGQSIAAITESVLGRPVRILFSVFSFLALILVVAVFAAAAGKTLATPPAGPKVVIPTFGLIFVAVVIGYLMYHTRANTLACSIVGLLLLFGLIWLGNLYPIELPVENPEKWWTAILLVYGLIASVTPVTLLLQPRDHLAAGVLFIGMVLGFGGLILTHPEIKAPAFVSFSSREGFLWPMLFVTIACGAISGFHSLVASGTTSKQLPRMSDARRIGYGGMIMESALSILALVSVTAGLYWMNGPEEEQNLIYQTFGKQANWIGAFGTGYGEITKALLGTTLGTLIGITMLKTFVMTTLDSATRITRYICNELLGDALGIPGMKNKYAATAVVGALAAPLALGNWKAIWPVFGASNQLIASVVLTVVSLYLITRGKKCAFVLIPGFLMVITTITALVLQTRSFLKDENPKYLLASISVLLIILAFFILYRGTISVLRAKRQLKAS